MSMSKEALESKKALEKKLEVDALAASPQTISKTLNMGVDIDFLNSSGRTPLSLAILTGKLERVELLVMRGAGVNYCCEGNATPLMFASHFDSIDIVRYLLKNKAQVNAQNAAGHTALHSASKTRNVDIAKLLLEHKADYGLRNTSGATPFMDSSGPSMDQLFAEQIKQDIREGTFNKSLQGDANIFLGLDFGKAKP